MHPRSRRCTSSPNLRIRLARAPCERGASDARIASELQEQDTRRERVGVDFEEIALRDCVWAKCPGDQTLQAQLAQGCVVVDTVLVEIAVAKRRLGCGDRCEPLQRALVVLLGAQLKRRHPLEAHSDCGEQGEDGDHDDERVSALAHAASPLRRS